MNQHLPDNPAQQRAMILELLADIVQLLQALYTLAAPVQPTCPWPDTPPVVDDDGIPF